MIIDITVNRRVSQIVGEQKGALTRRIHANNYGKCARQVLKMLDRGGTVRILHIMEQKRDNFRQLVTALQIPTRNGRDQGARRARQVPLCTLHMRPAYHGWECKYPR
jgi:hypothetical protein